MKRFYSKNIQSNYIYLEDNEAQHCTKVLRCKQGDKIEILNGEGKRFEAEIQAINKHEVQAQIIRILQTETVNKNKLSVAICPTKNPARFEWFLEKVTEIGVHQIFPILTTRTEKQSIKQDRMQNIVLSAAKQSSQLFFPILHELQPLKNVIESDNFEQHFIAHCKDEKQHLKNAYSPNQSAIILIGPEGDFTSEEINIALNKNYIPVSLGNSILRVETAGVVACSIIQMVNEI